MPMKSLFIVLSLTLTLGLSGITASTIASLPSTKPTSATVLDEYKKPPSFLFVVQAKEAVLKPVKDDSSRYTLSMTLSDDNLNKIIAFSDRPYRLVDMMTAKQLHDLWGEGKNCFKADPPNAALSGNGLDASIVIVESMTIDNGQLVYSLVPTDLNNTSPQPVRLKDMVLIIDGWYGHCVLNNAPKDGNCKSLGLQQVGD